MINEAHCANYLPAGDGPGLLREIQHFVSMDAPHREAIVLRGHEWILAFRRYETLEKKYLAVLSDQSASRAIE